MDQSRLFIKIIGVLALSSLSLFGVIYFVYIEIKEKNEKILTVDQDISTQNSKRDYLVLAQKLIEDIEPDIAKINNSIVNSNGDVAFIENLESIARSYNLSIQIESLTIENDPKNESNPVSTLKIKAKIDGSWANAYVFLSELESLPFKLKINKFNFISSGEVLSVDKTSSNIGWQALFEISVLKYK